MLRNKAGSVTWGSGNNLDDQAVFGDLDLLDEHPFWERKQGCPFHHNLILVMKDASGKDYITASQYYARQASSKPPKWALAI
ncbi:hypothetical protein KSX_66690 [Ktedonospora formicarum]|uniref:Uncharacterized protein n=1 Tax=Ktedonospora formicarum TaxID=2778364 RepID=A0A8J3MW16_9CHLR|nr:hypothetical protein [Ktedonospora formicarum]GHO48506.1 hypothetical protein KSX_66690 [Ktedonospora formicarum]